MRKTAKKMRESKVIIGQEAICPDGLGRVIAINNVFPGCWIQVKTYVDDRSCKWAPHNVTLIEPMGGRKCGESVFV